MSELMINKELLEKVWKNKTLKMDFRIKSNNWLKVHGRTMRRKPFERINPYVLLTETYFFLCEDK